MSLEVNIEKKLDGFTLRAAFSAGNTPTALLGASGCGKSMTLRCIAGIVKPDKGRIVLDGRVLFDSEQHIDLPPQQRGAGLLFQNYALFPNMTVEQNILCGLKAEKDRAARQVRCAELLRAMRLEPLAKRYPAQLSGGQQQRTALARILAGQPRILMLDEPFSALDSYLREAVESEVGSLLAGFDGTSLLVTHNRDEAYRLCPEMVVLDSGRVLRSGHTRDVFADPRSITAARLTGCKNILPCTRLDAHTVHLTGWDVPLQLALPVPEGCTAVGIRAHDFVPCDAGAPNALPVAALSSSENPFDWNLICTAPDGTARLWWKVSKSTLSSPAPVPPHFLCAAPESIMPLTNLATSLTKPRPVLVPHRKFCYTKNSAFCKLREHCGSHWGWEHERNNDPAHGAGGLGRCVPDLSGRHCHRARHLPDRLSALCCVGRLPHQRVSAGHSGRRRAGRVGCPAPGRSPLVLPGRGRGEHLCGRALPWEGTGLPAPERSVR